MMLITAQHGDKVLIHFTLKYPNGVLYTTTEGKNPVEFTLGKNILIKGMEEAIIGMKIDEEKTITLRQPFGPKIPDLILEIPLEVVPEHIEKTVGKTLKIALPDKRESSGKIAGITETHLIFDANKEPSGKDLILQVKLVMILEKC